MNNLKNYYKKIQVCIICNKKYGLDCVEDNHKCHSCTINKLNEIKLLKQVLKNEKR